MSRVKLLSRVQLFETPRTVAYQAPPSMGFSRQEYWSGLPYPSPGDLSGPGTEPGSPALLVDASCLSHQGSPGDLKPSLFLTLQDEEVLLKVNSQKALI